MCSVYTKFYFDVHHENIFYYMTCAQLPQFCLSSLPRGGDQVDCPVHPSHQEGFGTATFHQLLVPAAYRSGIN